MRGAEGTDGARHGAAGPGDAASATAGAPLGGDGAEGAVSGPAADGPSGRPAEIAAFLETVGWGGAERRPLAGDASARRYLRLRRGAEGAVLMDAPAASGEDVRPFLRIAGHLSGLGLSAPGILAADAAAGLVLLEDLGDGLFARLIEADPGAAPALYGAAADMLAALHAHPPPADLPAYAGALPGDQAALVLETYAPAPAAARADLAACVAEACARLAPGTPVLMLRDLHAENLIWLPGRAGVARVGLLDFQDAMAGHPAYDLVSLLRDARRDVPEEVVAATTARYLAATGEDAEAFAAAAAALGALRQLRILGVFARLARAGKPGYLRHMPRVWHHLQRDLARPELSGLAALVARLVPPPTPARLEALR